MNGRIVRLAAACLILVAAFVLYLQNQRNDLAADMLAGGCHSPETAPEAAAQGCSRLLEDTKYTPQELAVLHIYRGRAFVEQEDLQRALQDFNDAASLDADEHQAWQWVSYVLGKLGEDEAAFEAIEKAHRLGPANTYTMQQRFLLLKKLERYEEADAYFVRLKEKYPAAEDERLLWMPRELGQMRLELKQYGAAAEVFREVYRLDLTHKKTAAGFFEACMFAGPDCPPLFPERRANYPVLSCDEALKKWAEFNPERLEKALRDTGAETLTELV